MRVIVVGAGQVGRSILEALQKDHDVVVIERDPQQLEVLSQYDVLAIQGNGASLRVLKDAGAESADLMIACTNIDEVNIVACAGSKQLGTAFTIARVHDPEYLETWERGRLGVDLMICSEVLTSEVIAHLIGVPAAREIHTFAEGRILMAELLIKEGSPLIGIPLRELGLPQECMIASLIRDGKVLIPRGKDVIQAGDLMVGIGTPEAVGELNRRASGAARVREIVILGGGRIGYKLATLLEKQGLRPKIIEADPKRSQWLVEQLTRSQVFQSDGTDLEFLEGERIGDCEVGVCVMDRDEKNLLAALLLKSLGVGKVIAGVADAQYIKIFQRVGVDMVVSARQVIADEIIRFTKSHVAGISILEGERAEVLEMVVSRKSPLLGVPLRDSSFPKGAIIGAIIRGREVFVPRGDNTLQPGDRAIIFSTKEAASEVERLL